MSTTEKKTFQYILTTMASFTKYDLTAGGEQIVIRYKILVSAWFGKKNKSSSGS